MGQAFPNKVVTGILGLLVAFASTTAQPDSRQPRRASEPWDPSQLITPEELAKRVARPKGESPRILCVGFRPLYAQAHIPGSKYCGPARDPEGLDKLRACGRDLPRAGEIILYCGCCPWNECPNIRPAFRTLKQMGFTRLKLVRIPRDFGRDWVQKGFRAEKGA